MSLCLARPKGEVLCWGLDDKGQLGGPRLKSSTTPIEVGFER
ncbi:MAG: hypothetical protein ACE366_14470 [Bradymonadia bacterium]